MAAARPGRAMIEMSAETRDAVKLVRIQIAAAIQKDLNLGDCVGVLADLAKQYPNQTAEIAAKKIG